jgi:hypothetical protein
MVSHKSCNLNVNEGFVTIEFQVWEAEKAKETKSTSRWFQIN